MRPITLSRIVETAYIAQKEYNINKSRLAAILNIKMRRAKEILEEMTIMGLLNSIDEDYKPTQNCEKLLKYAEGGRFEEIHSIVMEHSYYNSFYTVLKLIEPATPDLILKNLLNCNIHFNTTTVDILCDWGERIGSIQRNIFSNQYYSISNAQKKIKDTFLDVYTEENIQIGVSMKKHYIEIPKVREMICQRLNMRRNSFDELFKDLYLKNIGFLELSGAPLTTKAKKCNKKIKKTSISELEEKIDVNFFSNKYLDGMDIDGKTYYYIAYHGGKLYE